jgi:hypothetical protein
MNLRATTLTFTITFAGLLNFKFHLKMKDRLIYLNRRYRMSILCDCPLSTAVKSGWIKGQHKVYPTRQNRIVCQTWNELKDDVHFLNYAKLLRNRLKTVTVGNVWFMFGLLYEEFSWWHVLSSDFRNVCRNVLLSLTILKIYCMKVSKNACRPNHYRLSITLLTCLHEVQQAWHGHFYFQHKISLN